jgi:glycosyltransferase involved in cell wall biosynthesis
MNILLINDRLDSYIGGVEQYIIILANELIKKHNVLLCSNSCSKEVKELLDNRIIIHGQWASKWENTKYELERYNFKPDIVHCNPFSAYTIGYLIAKHFNSKLVATHHCFRDFGFSKTFVNSVKKFIVVDHAIEKILIKNPVVPNKKIKVLYNSINLEKFKKNNINLNKDKKIIAFISRLEDNKELTAKQLIRISDKLNYKIIIVGSGVFKDELEFLAQNKKNIEFTGAVNNVEYYMNLSDLCICSARTAIEAVCCEKNVLQSGIGSFGELITLDNYKETIFDVTKYRKYTDQELIELIEYGINKNPDIELTNLIRKKCDINFMIEELEKIYLEVLNVN